MKVGLVGTGYAAKVRAEAFQADPRSHLAAVVGHTPDKTAEFAQLYEADAVTTYDALMQRADIDLVESPQSTEIMGRSPRQHLQQASMWWWNIPSP